MQDPVNAPHPDLIQARIDQAVLETQVKALETRLAAVEDTLKEVRDMLSEAKGGWRTMMALGGAAATVSAGIAYLIDKIIK